MLPQSESCVCSRLCDMHIFPVALLHLWISIHLAHSWEGGGCLSKRCHAFHHGNGTRECGRGVVVCYCFTEDLIKWLKGKGGKMQLLTQKMLSWACHLLKAGRLRSTAGSVKPFWIMCGCSVVAPLPFVGVLLTDTDGSCIQLSSGWDVPPTVRDQEWHLETWGKERGPGYFNIGVKRTLYLKALDKQQIILMSLRTNWAALFLLYKWKLWHWMIVILSQKWQLHGFSLSTCLVVCLMRFVFSVVFFFKIQCTKLRGSEKIFLVLCVLSASHQCSHEDHSSIWFFNSLLAKIKAFFLFWRADS